MTEFLDLETIRIAYTQHGSGPKLILLHGNSVNKHIFKDYQSKYFTDFHTFALDSRGHGESRSVDEVYTIDQYSDDVINFCKALEITEASVIGYSDGGNIALFLASKAPRLFTRVIAISPNYLVSGTTDAVLRLTRGLYQVLSFLNKVGFNLKQSLMRFDLMLTDIGITESDLSSIQTNVKIIYAEHDMIKETHLQQLAALIPNSSLDKILSRNHLTELNDKSAIKIMRDYLHSPRGNPLAEDRLEHSSVHQPG